MNGRNALVLKTVRPTKPPQTTRELHYKALKKILSEAAAGKVAGQEGLMDRGIQRIEPERILDKMLEGKNAKECIKILVDIMTDGDSSISLRQAVRERICSINLANDPARGAVW